MLEGLNDFNKDDTRKRLKVVGPQGGKPKDALPPLPLTEEEKRVNAATEEWLREEKKRKRTKM